MSQKKHMSIVRNKGYAGSEFNTRCRHNERKNEAYFNCDIVPERLPFNVHFKQHFKPDGSLETYGETYKRMLAEGTVSEKWLKPDSKIFAEMVFDINTTYFEERGGYEFAKTFYEEAYNMALKEVGSEDYIISAVMHADERNDAVSEKYGRDIYHYHLHVVYVPVVEKREYFRKNHKDPALAGQLKAVYTQISHAKKWPRRVPVERDGKFITLNSYSLLQDRYFEHMTAAGFKDFERGERGSTAEHLDSHDFKIMQDKARAEEAAALADEKEKALAVLEAEAEKKNRKLAALDRKLEVREGAEADLAALDTFGHNRTMLGKVIVTQDEAAAVEKLAREGVASRGKIQEMEFKLKRANHDIATLTKDRDIYKSRWEKLRAETAMFFKALARAPKRLMEFIADIMRQPPENAEPEQVRAHKKSRQEER